MPKLSTDEVKTLVAAEKADALSATAASKLSSERAKALDYYYGDMTTDMPTAIGRSKAVSTDVADTIEGLMPQLMDIFCSGDEVVRFEPVGPEDVGAAEQETDYVNHVFMQKNPGFLVLYSFIKDALLSKTGLVKVWYETKESVERETYYDLDEGSFTVLAGNPSIEIVEHSERPNDYPIDMGETPPEAAEQMLNAAAAGQPVEADAQGTGLAPEQLASNLQQAGGSLHDVTIEIRQSYGCPKVEAVPPEEFGIARNARSIRDAGYVFHEILKRQEELISQGYDRLQIEKLPSFSTTETIEHQARDTVEDYPSRGEEGLNDANRLIKVTEHYVRMDYEGDGKPALYRVTTGGDEGEVLIRDGKPDIVREDVMPFAAMTPVIVTHRFFGRSIADLVMDIQRIKTALLRGMLDNLYLHNNPRVEVPESHANEQTLDDLLVSRPGGVVRTKMPGGLTWQVVPDITDSIYPALQYMDATREWRTGVSRQGQGTDPNVLQNQVATIANQMFAAAQARMKLIARIFAETGIRDLFSLLHHCIRKYGSQPETVRLRNTWVTVDPRQWKTREDMTINVGLGTGSKDQQLAHLQLIIAAQEKATAVGLVSPKNLFNSAKELVKLVGHKDVNLFFTPPGQPPDPNDPTSAPLPTPPDPTAIEREKMQMQGALERDKAQWKIQLEAAQAEADIKVQVFKVQSEIALKREEVGLKMDGEAVPIVASEIARKLDKLSADFNKPKVKRVVRGVDGKPSHTIEEPLQ
jgi:hypothetical protein